jgi:hypothetical protein
LGWRFGMSLGRNIACSRAAMRWTARELAVRVEDGGDLARIKKTAAVIRQIESVGKREPARRQHTTLLPRLAEVLQISAKRLQDDDLSSLSSDEILALREDYRKQRPYDQTKPIEEQVERADYLQRTVIRLVMETHRTDEELFELKRYLDARQR